MAHKTTHTGWRMSHPKMLIELLISSPNVIDALYNLLSFVLEFKLVTGKIRFL